MTYCAAPRHAPSCVVVVADRTPLSDSSSALPGTPLGTCSRRPPFNTALLVALSGLIALTGCADRLAEVPTDRADAKVVTLEEPGHCPWDTVLLADDDSASKAGAIPADFNGRTVLRCDVYNSTMTSRAGVDRFTVRQWRGVLTPQLRSALALPDREFRRGGTACGVAKGGTTAIYVIDGGRRAVRGLPPTDEPCNDIRDDVETVLPGNRSPADQTFSVERAAR